MSRHLTVTLNGHAYTLDEMMTALDEMAEHAATLTASAFRPAPPWTVNDRRTRRG